MGKDDARKVVLTFEGRNVDLNIEGADGFIMLLHGENERKRRGVHFGSNLIVHQTGITLQNLPFFDGR